MIVKKKTMICEKYGKSMCPECDHAVRHDENAACDIPCEYWMKCKQF